VGSIGGLEKREKVGLREEKGRNLFTISKMEKGKGRRIPREKERGGGGKGGNSLPPTTDPVV